ncbi:MAG: hypothetical protein ACYCPT_08110 [Acidimicrobiales bacterium]
MKRLRALRARGRALKESGASGPFVIGSIIGASAKSDLRRGHQRLSTAAPWAQSVARDSAREASDARAARRRVV